MGHQVNVIRNVAKKVFAETGHTVSYKVGTMIEIPRAALIADEVNVVMSIHYIYCVSITTTLLK